MNYLSQIVAFEQWEELHPLSDKAYRLWFKLMAIANASGWDEWLSVPLLKLKSELHTPNDQTIMNARNALIQAGRIEVEKGKHGKSACYRIIPFPEKVSKKPNRDTNREDHRVSNREDSREDHRVIDRGVHRVSGRTYSKQDKTKQNKENSSGSDEPTRKTLAKKKRVYDHDSVEYKLADHLKQKIVDNDPDHDGDSIDEHRLQGWSDTFRLMIERDKRDPEKIKNLIDWCQNDHFWKTNILSAGALRKQYRRLRGQAVEDWKQGNVDPLDYEARDKAGEAYDDEYLRRYEHEFD